MKKKLCIVLLLTSATAGAEGFFEHNYLTAYPKHCAGLGSRSGGCAAGIAIEDLPRILPSIRQSSSSAASTNFGVVGVPSVTQDSISGPSSTNFGVIAAPPLASTESALLQQPAPPPDFNDPRFAVKDFKEVKLELDEGYHESLAPDLLSGGLFGSFNLTEIASKAATNYIKDKITSGINRATGEFGEMSQQMRLEQQYGEYMPGRGFYRESDYAIYGGLNRQQQQNPQPWNPGSYQQQGYPQQQGGNSAGSTNILDLGPSSSSSQYYEAPRTINGWSADSTMNY